MFQSHFIRVSALITLFSPALLTLQAATLYVAKDNPGALPPYDAWTNAAPDIQTAIDAASGNDTVIVSNGVYDTGGRPAGGEHTLTNRVTIDKAIRVESVNGPHTACIVGAKDPISTTSDSAIRCIWMINGASIAGFTATNGATGPEYNENGSGGGIWCASTNSIISNCVLTCNSATDYGGGSYYGTLFNCTITDNSAEWGGGSSAGILYNCSFSGNSAEYGGGVDNGILYSCVISSNSADTGGGSYNCTLYNCSIFKNSANNGGGTGYSKLYFCTISNNVAIYGGGDYEGNLYFCALTGNSAGSSGGGSSYGTSRNCVLQDNTAEFGGGGVRGGYLYNCVISGNWGGSIAGGALWSEFLNCTLSGNSAGYDGGGVYGCRLTNCIVYYNTSPNEDNYYESTFHNCCTTPDPGGTGNITDNPMFINETERNYRLQEYSPCIDVGDNTPASGTNDLDGNPRIVGGIVDMGAYEWQGYGPHPFLYVAAANPDARAPFTNWPMAAATIQDAIDIANPGDIIFVGNGVYNTGGRQAGGEHTLTNRVTIDKSIHVQSVNGPHATFIVGQRDPSDILGPAAVRCVWMTNGSSLAGFTLTNGATMQDIGTLLGVGGALWCENMDVIVSNCILTGNAAQNGGGSYAGTLFNCMIYGNDALYHGGGTYNSTLNNCTLIDNSAANSGGGAYKGTLNNCTLSDNTAIYYGGGIYWGTLNNCISYFNDAPSGPNEAFAVLHHCCITPDPGGTGNITNDPMWVDAAAGNFHLQAGSPCIDIGDNTVVFSSTDLDRNPRIVNGIVDLGAYEWQYCEIHPFLYVAAANPYAEKPYTNWPMAAATIQDAVDIANPGDIIFVSNGIYNTGGRPAGGDHTLTNRVTIDKAVRVQSVNGPLVTSIVGAKDPSGVLGPAAIRCVWMGSGSSLAGFTLTNGASELEGTTPQVSAGGGVWCENVDAIVSNCILVGNTARYGAGSYVGSFDDCLFYGNSANYAGGGACNSTLNNCTLFDNESQHTGGGMEKGLAQHCVLYENNALCGGGIYLGTLNNCIVYSNTATSGPNFLSATLNYCCTTPDPGGTGNITNDPVFVDAAASNFRLQAASPCLDAGQELGLTRDIEGTPRPLDGNADGTAAPDMGAFEFVNTQADTDGDFYHDQDELWAGTSPINPNSFLALEWDSASMSGDVVSWMGVAGRHYTVMSATNLLKGDWSNLAGATDIPGHNGPITITNTVTTHAQRFLRVLVGP